MDPKVVDISGKPRVAPLPGQDFWFAQVDHRLGRIEGMVFRLERLVWVLVCGSAALVIFEIVNVLSKGAN
ncbi:hypothetical protein [Yoonia sp.]|uniref:hypothetical protein n=1 Tax=Yoonia sp. TaxID=2212373 RepID=UPI002FDB3E17